MAFEEWFDEVEIYGLRSERFYSDLDHHRENSHGSYERMVNWLRSAYEVGRAHEQRKYWDDLK